MVIGEDKSKVSNIVKDNMEHFRILYNNILQECPQVVYKPQQGKLEVRIEFCFEVFFCSFCPSGHIKFNLELLVLLKEARPLCLSGYGGGMACVPVSFMNEAWPVCLSVTVGKARSAFLLIF